MILTPIEHSLTGDVRMIIIKIETIGGSYKGTLWHIFATSYVYVV